MLGSQTARLGAKDRTRDDRANATEREALLGLEHEFVVRGAAGPVDFRGLIHGLGVPGRRVDPYDRNAYRCAWGGTITADDGEAEVAIAPVNQVGGFTGVADARARIARAALEVLLPAGLGLEGYSTHLSVSTPIRYADATARLVARAFGPALILMTDRVHSPGLLVMPRPGRTELGVEYVDGARLRAASALAVGSVLAATAAAGRRPRQAGSLPGLPAIEVEVRAAVRRFGWYVDRAAFGTDILAGGRAALLRRIGGGTIRAGEHLEAAWESARAALAGIAAPADLAEADRFVDGSLPLPVEDPTWRLAEATDPGSTLPPTPFGELAVPRRRQGFALEAVVVTWDFAVFALARTGGRVGYASVPRAELGDFLAHLDRGELDGEIAAFLDGPRTGRFLAGWEPAHQFGYHDAVAPLAAFAPPERDPRGEAWTFDLSASPPVPAPTVALAAPAGGAAAAIVADTAATAEPKLGKVPQRPVTTAPPPTTGRAIPWIPIGVIAAVIIALLGVGSAIGLLGGKAAPSPSPSQPAVGSPTLAVASPSAPVATCTGPLIEIVDLFHPDVAETGGATPPVFSTPAGTKFCLAHLATYHWNGGAGAPAGGTLTLLDSARSVLGTWKAIATPGTNNVLSGWEADIPTATTPVILDGTYTVQDSDPATLSWSKASGGMGFVRVWAQLYAPPGTTYSLPPPNASPSAAAPASVVSISGMIQSDSPTLDQCGAGQNSHNVYSFVVLLAIVAQSPPPLSAYGSLLGRTATVTLKGPPDAGTYTTKIADFHGFAQIRIDGHKCPTTTARSTFGGLTIDGLTLRPGPGNGFLADPPTP